MGDADKDEVWIAVQVKTLGTEVYDEPLEFQLRLSRILFINEAVPSDHSEHGVEQVVHYRLHGDSAISIGVTTKIDLVMD